ncbi:MAG TPA: hypothetical protein VGI67_01910 [Thermoleophilaceae bacterium]
MKPPLRVAALVDSLTVPAWVAWTLDRIAAADGLDLAAVVAAAQPHPPPPAGYPVYRAYEWADRRVFGPAPAMRPAELAPPIAGRRTSRGDEPLDVVVSFLPATRAAWDGAPPRHGVWAIVPFDDGRPESAPSRFWELRRGGGMAATALVELRGGVPRVLARDFARADHLSLTRTRNAAAWSSGRLVLRCLRRLLRDDSLAASAGTVDEEARPPGAGVAIRHAALSAGRGVAARCRTALRRDEWFVAVRPRAPDDRPASAVRALPNPPGRYLADPFPIEVSGRHFLFVEDYSRAARRGRISVSEAGPGGVWSPPRTVLQSEHHLSYPFVFEHEGEIYMLPETSEAGRIELHRAVAFPDRWRLEQVLLDGLTAVDPTLHIEDGRCWLFANVVEGEGDRGELCLFSAGSLDGPWRPHPRNPIVTDPARARPAGRLFRRDGWLIRPGQDCARGYGQAVVLSRVDTLSASDYRETPVDRLPPDWLSGIEGTHTYTFDSRYECLDGYRHVSRLGSR